MAIARVQASTATSITSGTALAPSWPSATTAGNLLLLVIGFNTWPSNPTFTVPSGWTEWERNDTPTTVRPAGVIYAIENAGSRSGTESITVSADCDCVAWLLEYSGAATSAALDVTALDVIDTDTSVESGTTAETAQADEAAVGLLLVRPNSTGSPAMGAPSNSFTEIEEAASRINNTEGINALVADKILSATGAQSTAATVASGHYNCGLIVTFKAAAAGGGTSYEKTGFGLIESGGQGSRRVDSFSQGAGETSSEAAGARRVDGFAEGSGTSETGAGGARRQDAFGEGSGGVETAGGGARRVDAYAEGAAESQTGAGGTRSSSQYGEGGGTAETGGGGSRAAGMFAEGAGELGAGAAGAVVYDQAQQGVAYDKPGAAETDAGAGGDVVWLPVRAGGGESKPGGGGSVVYLRAQEGSGKWWPRLEYPLAVDEEDEELALILALVA